MSTTSIVQCIGYIYGFKQIFSEVKSNILDACTIAGKEFTITVVTSNKFFAGTDAHPYVILEDEKNSSGKLPLQGGKNERGCSDKYKITVPLVKAPIKSVRLGHDNSGLAPAWSVDKVIVFDPETSKQQTFNCGKTLSSDDQLERTLQESTGNNILI